MRSLIMTKKINVFFVFLIIMVLGSSCSKTPGKTASRLKIFSGNFSTILSSKANNGLVLYGQSSDGRYSFTKKVDTDTIDIVFPNGVWNFYAISWELGTPSGIAPDFRGKTYCGKVLGQNLTGNDVSITLNIANANCSDVDFSLYTKLNSTDIEFPQPHFYTCKDLSPVNTTSGNTTSCDQNVGANFNKGYHTSYKVILSEYRNLGADILPPTKVFESACVIANKSTLAGGIESASLTALSQMRIPITMGKGLSVSVLAYYSDDPSGCNPSLGYDVLPLNANARAVAFTSNTTPMTYNYFIETTDADVCTSPRLTSTGFAGGHGVAGSPYAICTKDQLTFFTNNFSTYKESSFDLLTDINFGMTQVTPIGDPLQNAGGSPGNYYGKISATYQPVFDGRNHKIEDFKIKCTLPTGTAANDGVGFFRFIKNAEVRNLTFNNGIILCDGANQVGVLTGLLSDTLNSTKLENIKVHGHTEGKDKVGGVAGDASGSNINAHNIHIKGDYSGSSYVGALFGNLALNGSATALSQITFQGDINANHGVMGPLPTTSWVGGIIGKASGTNLFSIDQVVVKAKRIEGSTMVGGFIGEAGNVNLSNSYVEAVLKGSGATDGSTYFTNMGGAIGLANSGSLSKIVAANGLKYSNRLVTPLNDHTYGGLVGNTSGTAPSCSASFYTSDNDSSGPVSCGVQLTVTQSQDRSSYITNNFSLSSPMGSWNPTSNVPALTVGCSPSETGHYYEVSSVYPTSLFGSVLPGDIILCNGTTNSLVTLLNVHSTLTSTYVWEMPDHNYDIPRLSFEADIEDEIDYLKRDCHGHYTTQYGTGTAADPKWICTYSQFYAMSGDTSSHYQLKKNISYDGTAGNYIPLPAGDYKLNGSGYGLYNFSMTFPATLNTALNYGIFSELTTGAVLSNIRIVGASLSEASLSANGSGIAKIGLLTGVNDGLVSNVTVSLSKVDMNAVTAVAGAQILVGGGIGYNSGTISKSEFDVRTSVTDGSFPISSTLVAAGAVAKNNGIIEAVKSHSLMQRNFGCPGSGNYSPSPYETVAGFIGVNDAAGVIKEVESGGEMRVGLVGSVGCSTSTGGYLSPFIAYNLGSVEDFDVNPRFYLDSGSTSPGPELFSLNTGSVSRGFVTIETSEANKIMNQSHTLVASWNASTDGSNPNPAIAPQTTCSTPGNYYDVAVSSASSYVGPVNAGDVVMCNGATNIVIPAAYKTGIMTPMTEVLYLVRTPASAPPTLLAGRYFDKDLDYSIGTGLKIDVISPPSTIWDSPTWLVTSDFLDPQGNTWSLDLDNGSTTDKKPELVNVGGSLEQLGLPF